MKEITICMGSSCFSRGNKYTIVTVKEYLKKNKLEDKVLLKGNLCEGLCENGPNICIDGVLYQGVDSNSVIDILNHCLATEKL